MRITKLKCLPMNISSKQTEIFIDTLGKIQRYFCYKYEISKEDLGLVIRSNNVHVLIQGKSVETCTLQSIHSFQIIEKTGGVHPKT